MDAELGFFEWVFRGLTAILVTAGGYLFMRTNKNSEDINATNLKFSEYKLEAEKHFSNKESIQLSLARLYDVLEEHRDESRESMIEIRQDIKNIILRNAIHG